MGDKANRNQNQFHSGTASAGVAWRLNIIIEYFEWCRVTFLVLADNDGLVDLGVQSQVVRVIANIRPDRQTVVLTSSFPATVTP